MPLANAAAIAMIKPIKSSSAKPGFTKPMVAEDAINRLEGPSKGMRFNPKATAKRSTYVFWELRKIIEVAIREITIMATINMMTLLFPSLYFNNFSSMKC
jgi:hypothetical protein